MPESEGLPQPEPPPTDLPDGLDLGAVVAIDTETMGLDPRRDRLLPSRRFAI